MSVERMCYFCKKWKASYKCPKCLVHYCSIDCYKSKDHDECTEEFYRECCMDFLAHDKVSDKNKESMENILRREMMHQSGRTSSTTDDVTERFKDITFEEDPEIILNRLTKAERRHFSEVIGSPARLQELMAIWIPWWTRQPSLIDEMQKGNNNENNGEAESNDDDDDDDTPELYAVASLMDLLGPNRQPHPHLVFSIVNVVLAYAFALRLYNGDVEEMRNAICDTICELAQCLPPNNYTFSSCEEAFVSFQNSALHRYPTTDSMWCRVLEDTLLIFQSNGRRPCSLLQPALSHMLQIIGADKHHFRTHKKLCFFLSWSCHYECKTTASVEDRQAVVLAITALHCEYLHRLQAQQTLRELPIKRAPVKCGKAIEEIA